MPPVKQEREREDARPYSKIEDGDRRGKVKFSRLAELMPAEEDTLEPRRGEDMARAGRKGFARASAPHRSRRRALKASLHRLTPQCYGEYQVLNYLMSDRKHEEKRKSVA